MKISLYVISPVGESKNFRSDIEIMDMRKWFLKDFRKRSNNHFYYDLFRNKNLGEKIVIRNCLSKIFHDNQLAEYLSEKKGYCPKYNQQTRQ